MDGIQTSETPVASTGTVDSPSTTADSSVSAEANQSALPVVETGAQVATEQADQGTNASPASDEFPDDAAFQQLPGEQRSTHWKQARERIQALNQQLAERQAQLEQIQQQQAQPDNQNWVSPNLLFAPQLDPNTGQPALDQWGEPITTPAPFVERLRAESPNTFGEMVYAAMDQPWDGDESTARALFRDYYGLNPDLFETYKQIQSPEDAQSYVAPITDLSHVPQQYHELYKSLDWETRDQVDSIVDDAARNLALRGLNAEFQQKQAEQQRNQQAIQERQRIQQERSQKLGEEIGTGVRQLVRSQFEKSVQLTGEPETDSLLWDVLLSYGENQLLRDPQAKPLIERLFGEKGLINSGESHLARSQQPLLATNAVRLVKKPIEAFSKLASDARKYRELQRQWATPRAEIGANGSNGFSQPAASNNGLSRQSNVGSLFNAEEVAQLAAEVRARIGG